MAFFGVTIEELEWVKPHPNPIVERLEIAQCKDLGFTFCIGKGQHKAGDKVLYFPIDSLIPPEVLQKMGLEGKLSGKLKNRVRTKTLQGYPSQGIIASLSLIDGLEDKTPEKITEFLGVTKYEAPEVMDPCGRLLLLPNFVSKYDIEGIDRNLVVFERLLEMQTYITEKIEGSHMSVSHDFTTNTSYVNQRNFTIVEIEAKEHTFWKVARKLNLFEKIKRIGDYLDVKSNITLCGEMIGPGIQSNIYKLNEHKMIAFDIKVDGKWINAKNFVEICKGHNIESVPVLGFDVKLKDWLNGKSVKEASNGESKLFKTLREGIVIKPMIEEFCPELSSRLFLKQRDPIYLANES